MESLFGDFEEKTKEYRKLEQELITKVKNKMLNTKIDDGIAYLNDNCFTINFSKLAESKSWSPRYFDSKQQIKAIIEKIDKASGAAAVKKCLTDIVKQGYIKESSNNKIFINDSVKNLLMEILK